ncbi:MAG: 1-acyl-sn-glycerol-3-phosphate acyltransferase, partial [Rhodocyclaceae bacterium]|nr:1-acyl-sn-glycerol-3-phosphate acyltransferase [Rhodocyclaceae bacterium]
ALFPEGTTTDGTQVLHFHAALLQPAIATGHAIQPLALRYLTPEGRHTRAAAYDGDVTLAACLASIIATPRIDVHVSIAPGMSTAGTHRRDIATAARAAIVAHVAPTNADALAA